MSLDVRNRLTRMGDTPYEHVKAALVSKSKYSHLPLIDDDGVLGLRNGTSKLRIRYDRAPLYR